ncbi:hypothetical protein D9613_007591 [Agrocybe pediades]|uniref:PX domain-containing protein n=1 Tax=Agrocybe pediades TaxID=84607 RepID=A0A8H4VMR5_9AGAR|nr:hypothetical protein D9613_007591 [Agrocybe pediades]
MLLGEFSSNVNNQDVGLPSDAYKRAVLRAPPSRFSVEFLPYTKTSGSYNHGMRISPIVCSDDVSVSSRGRNVEYDIWRRWEDCLWLQETLESEYKRAAREKKVRLQQGKGVKTYNGFYKQDMASSWESLPPGPDPNSVAQDIHQHLPKLSKKGTLFRASQSTIENRQKEFQVLIETLFSDAMPALIQEIRASSIITNFFGFWRRDYDVFQASNKGRRNSLTSSIFSSYFSESNPSISSKSPTSSVRSSSRSSSNSFKLRNRVSSTSSSGSDVSEYTYDKRSSIRSNGTHRPRPRPSSVNSSDSSSTHSDRSYGSRATTSSDPTIVDDASLAFGHDPQQPTAERPNSILQVLPEEREMLAKTEMMQPFPLQRKSRASVTERKANRGFSIIGMPLESCDENRAVDHRSVRESWQTTASMDSTAEALLEGLDLNLPHKIKEQKFRASIASISTFMTTDSADAVIPRSDSPTPSPSPTPTERTGRRNLHSHLRISTPLSLSDFEIYSDADGDVDSEYDELRSLRDCDSVLDAFPRPNSYLPSQYRRNHASGHDSRPETPTTATSYDSSEAPATPDSTRSTFTVNYNYNPPPSPTASVSTAFTGFSMSSTMSSSTTGSMPPGSIAIKAAFNSSIILLRVPGETPFHEVRQRLYNKFIGQEGVPLSHDFSVAHVPSTSSGSVSAQTSPVKVRPSRAGGVRSRAESVSTTTASERMDLVFVESESHWERIVSSMTGTKLTLRIFDCEVL